MVQKKKAGRTGGRRCLAIVILLTLGLSSAGSIGQDRARSGWEDVPPIEGSLLADEQPETDTPATTGDIEQNLAEQGFKLPNLAEPDNLAPALQLVILLTVLSLAPAILVLCTSFTRIIIVLSLLRQALGTQNLPPNQVLIGLSLFMTFVVMGPTWAEINGTALQPYLDGEITQQAAPEEGVIPMRNFMISQIIAAENEETVAMFQEFVRAEEGAEGFKGTWDEVATTTLIPAFVLSELKVAFLMGFKIYLPFLIVDMVIAAVLISMGMMMLPPVLISLPFKLLLFVLVDGWVLLVGSLMASFAVAGGAGVTRRCFQGSLSLPAPKSENLLLAPRSSLLLQMSIDPDLAVDLVRRMLILVLLLSAPILIAGLIVGVVVSLVQAVTQIQEQSLSFIPKIIAMFAAAIVTLPWMTSHLLEFARELFTTELIR